ncbi:MAG: hypothetical protein JOS17DRAFT_748084 [Linnemannia elongata]|nr:MAG: hypothetical protein JOS17DRAFT_748084 [Linnemannia elongata]
MRYRKHLFVLELAKSGVAPGLPFMFLVPSCFSSSKGRFFLRQQRPFHTFVLFLYRFHFFSFHFLFNPTSTPFSILTKSLLAPNN